jgi:Glutamate synthase central domain
MVPAALLQYRFNSAQKFRHARTDGAGAPLQVTNPAIDPFRESVVTSLRTFIGPEGDLSAIGQGHAYRLELKQPILTLTEMAAIKRMDFRGWHTNVIDCTYDVSMGEEGLQKTLRRVCHAAERAISWGYQILVRAALLRVDFWACLPAVMLLMLPNHLL